MSYTYFRFYLDQKETKDLKTYQSILKKSNGLGYVRASFDLNSPTRSISILSKSKRNPAIDREQWIKFLKKNMISINDYVESSKLKQEKHFMNTCSHEDTCNHTHADHHNHRHTKKGQNKNNYSKHHTHIVHETHWRKAVVGILWGISILVLSFSGFNIPIIAYYILNSLTTLLTLYLGQKVYQAAWHSLKQKKLNMAVLYSISTLTLLGISTLSLIIPGFSLMLESAPLILGFWHLGEAIEHHLLKKINDKLDVRDCAPKVAKLRGKPYRTISVTKLVPNDVIVIYKGEVVPIDGILRQPAALYTTRVDGSAFLKHFRAGDSVKAGMSLARNHSTIEIQVTKTYQNSYLSLIAQNINKANQEKAPIELLANKILKYFVPGLLAVAVTSGIVIGALYSTALAIQCVISILVSACPCALSLITPLAVRIGMKKASEHGVHYKNGKSLQAAADIDTIVFDLNGTLTKGEVTVTKMTIKDRKLLKYFALLENYSNHPVSKVIKRYFVKQGIKLNSSLKISKIDKTNHSGVKALINGELFLIGNEEMLRANRIKDIDREPSDLNGSSIFMVRDSKIVGKILLADRLRDDAITTVKRLQLMGKQVHICTGADITVAKKYAKLLGIPLRNICANAVGATTSSEISKQGYIKELQKCGKKVAMVGDAANDLSAIASADIGIAVKSSIGDKVTERHAGMLIQQGHLFTIASAFDVATKTKTSIFQNLFISLLYNSITTIVASGLFVTVGLTLNPAIGVLLMSLESAVVLANLYRLKRQEILMTKAIKEGSSNQRNELANGESCYMRHSHARRQGCAEHTNSAIELSAWKKYRSASPSFNPKNSKIQQGCNRLKRCVN